MDEFLRKESQVAQRRSILNALKIANRMDVYDEVEKIILSESYS